MPESVWIDTHVHVSDVGPDGQPRTGVAQGLREVLDRETVELRFIMSCDTPWQGLIKQQPDAMAQANRMVYEMARQAPGRLYGSCTVNPNFLDESLRVMEKCFGQWGFVQLGEMLQYAMDYRMDSDATERLVRVAVEAGVPVQVHISTSNRGTHTSTFGDEQLYDLFGLVHRIPEGRYVLAHMVGEPDDNPPVVEGYLDIIEGEFGKFPDNFWVEIRDFNSPGVATALARVPSERLLAGTDWTTRIGPPFLPYGVIFGVQRAEDNPYPPSIAWMIKFLKQAGATDAVVRQIAFENAAALYGLESASQNRI